MNTSLIEQALKRKSNDSNRINLGCANGWLNETDHLYEFLRENLIENTSKHEYIGRCYSQYEFDVKLENQIYTVVYTVDSGD